MKENQRRRKEREIKVFSWPGRSDLFYTKSRRRRKKETQLHDKDVKRVSTPQTLTSDVTVDYCRIENKKNVYILGLYHTPSDLSHTVQ
jgi:hypothetical protein